MLKTRLYFSVLILCFCTLLTVGCTKKREKERETLEGVYLDAKNDFTLSKEQFMNGDLDQSTGSFNRATQRLVNYASKGAYNKYGDPNPNYKNDQETYRDKTAYDWEEIWIEEHLSMIDANWVIVENTLREQNLTIASYKGHLSSLGDKYMVTRLNDSYKSLKSTFEQQLQNQYIFDCRDDARICDPIKENIQDQYGEDSLARYLRNTNKAQGEIDTEIKVLEVLEYRKAGSSLATLPTKVSIDVIIASNGGTSNDGTYNFKIANMPASVTRSEEISSAVNDHYTELAKQIDEKFPSLYGKQ